MSDWHPLSYSLYSYIPMNNIQCRNSLLIIIEKFLLLFLVSNTECMVITVTSHMRGRVHIFIHKGDKWTLSPLSYTVVYALLLYIRACTLSLSPFPWEVYSVTKWTEQALFSSCLSRYFITFELILYRVYYVKMSPNCKKNYVN